MKGNVMKRLAATIMAVVAVAFAIGCVPPPAVQKLVPNSTTTTTTIPAPVYSTDERCEDRLVEGAFATKEAFTTPCVAPLNRSLLHTPAPWPVTTEHCGDGTSTYRTVMMAGVGGTGHDWVMRVKTSITYPELRAGYLYQQTDDFGSYPEAKAWRCSLPMVGA